MLAQECGTSAPGHPEVCENWNSFILKNIVRWIYNRDLFGIIVDFLIVFLFRLSSIFSQRVRVTFEEFDRQDPPLRCGVVPGRKACARHALHRVFL